VLDVNRLEADAMPLDRVSVDLHRVAAEAISNLGGMSRQARVTLVAACPGQFCATADAAVIRRVVANLVANAIKVTPRAGDVWVEAFAGPSGPGLRVRDTGPGIPRADQESIFDKFGQLGGGRASGVASSGLGLTFCRLAVEAHGGRIGVDSEVGKGSTFWFTLPGAGSESALRLPALAGEARDALR
ncbi:MAG: HAMP domain-containing sensor histidine kinase, partial [Gemmatimonadota bacterium]